VSGVFLQLAFRSVSGMLLCIVEADDCALLRRWYFVSGNVMASNTIATPDSAVSNQKKDFQPW
jgi:hypothetical protein